MRVLLIGASGFVGRYLARELTTRGHEVAQTSGSEREGYVRLDVTDSRALTRLLDDGYDAVINLAASGVTNGSASSELMESVNTRGPIALATAVRDAARHPWLIHVASSTESMVAGPAESAYSATKAAGTRALSAVLDGVPHVIARIHNAYGVDQPRGRFIGDTMHRLATGEAVELRHPDRIRDFCLVEDITAHLANVTESVSGSLPSVEIGTGVGTSLLSAATIMAHTLQAEPSLVRVAPSADENDPHHLQIADSTADGFLECTTGLPEGITMLAEAARMFDRK